MRFTLLLIVMLGPPALAADVDEHADFDAILRDVVRGDRVDYARARDRHAPALRRYLDRLSETDPDALPQKQRLAFYLNLYNATMLDAVLQRGGSRFRPSDEDFAVFKAPLVRLSGRRVALNDLENGIIRPQFNDPRIHAALNCAAVSCPPLLARAYRGDDLDAVLDENVRRWLADPSRNVVDEAARVLRLSRIFDWYGQDFGGPEALRDYVGRALGRDFSGWRVEFLDYDWTLNAAEGT